VPGGYIAQMPPARHPEQYLTLAAELRSYSQPWPLPEAPADWDQIEDEALDRGCTVADVLYDRAGPEPS
jgi:hypothetical protein